ncbi:MAG TPA: hypothetical protein VIC35_09115 [Acidimicrobiia bacterium]
MSTRPHKVTPAEVVDVWDLVSRADCHLDVGDDGRVKLHSSNPIPEWLITMARGAVDGLDALATAEQIVDSFGGPGSHRS